MVFSNSMCRVSPSISSIRGPGIVALPFSRPYPICPSASFSAYILMRRVAPPLPARRGSAAADGAACEDWEAAVSALPPTAATAPEARRRLLKARRVWLLAVPVIVLPGRGQWCAA